MLDTSSLGPSIHEPRVDETVGGVTPGQNSTTQYTTTLSPSDLEAVDVVSPEQEAALVDVVQNKRKIKRTALFLRILLVTSVLVCLVLGLAALVYYVR